MSTAEAASPVADAEADACFAEFATAPALVLAVSGGPDSTALMLLASRWRQRCSGGPRLLAITIDHGLRPEGRREAAAVKRLAKRLGVDHRTIRWTGPKPATGLQEKARIARYRLLLAAARRAKAPCVLTAHTLDDQAETVLFRIARGSGVAGIGGMARSVSLETLLPDRAPARSPGAAVAATDAVQLVRPFLHLEKARLVATLQAAGIGYVQDPSNADPRFSRTRMRGLMTALSAEGLTAHRLAHFADRVRRSEAAIQAAVAAASDRIGLSPGARSIALDSRELRNMPDEIALRLIGRAIGMVGDEGPVELGKLEALNDAVMAAVAAGQGRFRRTLAGAMVSLEKDCITIARAPARRHRARS